jgi:sugar phosphate isomerase/epimerase
MRNIRIGTLVRGPKAANTIPQIITHGFECFAVTFQKTTGNIDLADLGKRVVEACRDAAEISCVSIYGNPLLQDEEGETARKAWEELIDHAHHFATSLVTGFVGRIPDVPVPDSLPRFKAVFGELARRAADKGLSIAFENWPARGSWNSGTTNFAFHPDAWELMFDALPAENLGLEWEPGHQMTQLIDPIPQLRKWAKRIFHLHGKDSTIAWDIVKEHGILSEHRYVWDRTPGFGDCDWADIITILRQNDYQGNIDIEGWHDPVYRDELEMTGQVHALNYLKNCRGGDLVPNPTE